MKTGPAELRSAERTAEGAVSWEPPQ